MKQLVSLEQICATLYLMQNHVGTFSKSMKWFLWQRAHLCNVTGRCFFQGCWIIISISDIFKNSKCLLLHFWHCVIGKAEKGGGGWCHNGSCRESGDKDLISSFQSMRTLSGKDVVCCRALMLYAKQTGIKLQFHFSKIISPNFMMLWWVSITWLQNKMLLHKLYGQKYVRNPWPHIFMYCWSGAVFQGLGSTPLVPVKGNVKCNATAYNHIFFDNGGLLTL